MAEFEPRVTEPLSIRYHNASVHTAILPNGGLTALQTLKMLETLELPGDDDPHYWHLLAEVLKFAWRDRLRFLADPAYCPVPQTRLLSDDYAAGRAATLRDVPVAVDHFAPDLQAGPGAGTLHLAAADGEGNLVSLTISQGNTFGSCFTVPGMGVILGHGMCRLDPRPGQMNSIAGGKRPLNNAAPLLIESPDRMVAIGVPGGRKIVSVMARAAQQLVDTSATVDQVCRAARLHVETAEPIAVHDTLPAPIQAELQRMGHRLAVHSQIAGVMNGTALDLATGQTTYGSAVAGTEWVPRVASDGWRARRAVTADVAASMTR
jgi:gamma-glutamyltranspeptidase/glutathione hydrolase